MSSTDRIFCGRSRTELDDERALACRFPTGIPYVRVALFLFEWRWSHNFVNRGRGERRAALPKTRARSHECLDCSRQTSFTAGTIMHRSKLPLTAWFRAAHLVTTRLSDRHDPRVALVGPCVLSFRCQGRSQAKSTARRAYGWGARQNRSPSPNAWCARASGPRKPTRTPSAGTRRGSRTSKRTLNHDLYRTGDRMSPGSIVPAAVKAVSCSEKDWWEHVLGVPTVGHIPSVRFQSERISVSVSFPTSSIDHSTSSIDHIGTRIDPDQTELKRDT
jgi:hypothetical protein